MFNKMSVGRVSNYIKPPYYSLWEVMLLAATDLQFDIVNRDYESRSRSVS